jgi:WD40 repeat protein
VPGQSASAVAFSGDGKRFATGVAGPPGRVVIWDTASGKELRAIEGVPERAASLAFTPDGRHLLAGLEDSSVLVWELAR